MGPEGAVEALGMDDAYPIDDLDEILPGLLEGRTRVYYHFGRDTEFDLQLIGWLNRVRAPSVPVIASDADVARVAGPSTVRRTVSADTVGENGSMGRSIGPASSSQ